MFHVAFPRGQGPAYADLPPTLQPHVIAASAPPADHLRTVLLSGLIYFSLVAAVVALSSLAPPPILIHPQPPPAGPTIVVEPPTYRVVLPPPVVTGGMARGNESVPTAPSAPPSQAPPTEAPAGLPTQDRRLDPPAGSGPGTAAPGATAPTGSPTVGAGPVIHDFTSVGLAVLRQVDPIYPDFARHARIQGPVVLMMTVDEQGRPIQVQVLEGHPVFHEAAKQAARQWRFEPARMNGQPVSAAFRLTLKFSLR
ncbi:MAG: energy transducer TonB [Geothrix sp.]|uniref:energy transducer TonB n=1 Tax=Geothrix sp. TaxID=1962974 RepID=UPI0017FC9383|nr:energy transducer TonB [Geothrix sp.]NWJ40314.1 energy transducer TonB [Geothrix sp.]WIL21681.1 MAG: TonB family protein [Geothrix sp.]